MRHPELARAASDAGLAKIMALIERCLSDGVRRLEISVDDVSLAARYFFTVSVREPFDRAIRGLDPPGLDAARQRDLRLAVDFFLKSCRR